MSFKPRDINVRFWSKVDKQSDEECWNWMGSCIPFGYGQFGVTLEFLGVNSPGRTMGRAHRVAWILTNGHIPDGLHVCHKCDNRTCCNPNHLFLGTAQDNVDDMMQKKRNGFGRTGRTRLHSDKKIGKAIAEYAQGEQDH